MLVKEMYPQSDLLRSFLSLCYMDFITASHLKKTVFYENEIRYLTFKDQVRPHLLYLKNW